MKEFLLKIGSKVSSLPTEKFSKYETKKIDDLILKHFGLSDLGKLRDKFEGESFRINKTKMLLSYISVCKYLNIEPVDYSYINLAEFIPLINYKGEKYRVVVSDFGSFPILEKNEKLPFIFVISRAVLDYKIVGYCTLKDLNNTNNYVIDNFGRKEYKSIDSLKNLSNE
jgi:hypothetical protein